MLNGIKDGMAILMFICAILGWCAIELIIYLFSFVTITFK